MASNATGGRSRRSISKSSIALSLTEAALANLLTDQLNSVLAERHWAAVITMFLP
jgi:hypothetical protein